MADEASGAGEAFDALVDTTASVPDDDGRAAALAAVDGAERKVAKETEALAAAEQSLEHARAALAALDEEGT